MRKFFLFLCLSFFSGVVFFPSKLLATENESMRAQIGFPYPPFGDCFLRGDPGCVIVDSIVESVDYTPELERLMHSVWKKVNENCRQTPDPAGEDVWSSHWDELLTGWPGCDCEDTALTMKVGLMRAGVPSGALRIALITGLRRDIHAVLFVVTDRGNYALDNGFLLSGPASLEPLIKRNKVAISYAQDRNGRLVPGVCFRQGISFDKNNPFFVKKCQALELAANN